LPATPINQEEESGACSIGSDSAFSAVSMVGLSLLLFFGTMFFRHEQVASQLACVCQSALSGWLISFQESTPSATSDAISFPSAPIQFLDRFVQFLLRDLDFSLVALAAEVYVANVATPGGRQVKLCAVLERNRLSAAAVALH
jgi:hypothetical protein